MNQKQGLFFYQIPNPCSSQWMKGKSKPIKVLGKNKCNSLQEKVCFFFSKFLGIWEHMKKLHRLNGLCLLLLYIQTFPPHCLSWADEAPKTVLELH